MMLHDILEILKADEKLSNLLQATKADSKIYMYQGKQIIVSVIDILW